MKKLYVKLFIVLLGFYSFGAHATTYGGGYLRGNYFSASMDYVPGGWGGVASIRCTLWRLGVINGITYATGKIYETNYQENFLYYYYVDGNNPVTACRNYLSVIGY